MSKTFRIAAIAGDGIGKEVLPEGLRVLEQAAKIWDLNLSIEVLDWAHCDYYLEHGQMMPDDWFEQLKGFDAIYFGAVGWPDKVPDHISLWGSLLKFRRDFDQYVNIRPVRLFPGVPTPLADSVVARGARLYERTAVSEIASGRVLTDHGTVTSDVVIRATEGFTRSLRGQRRAVAPVYSLMIATEPLPDALWDEIGLDRRETFTDGRHLVIYGQRTADGRFAFGGRGAPYHFASAIKPEFDRDPAVHDMIHNTLVELFPQVGDAAITHRWGGPLGIPRDWFCSVGLDRATGLGWGGGYVGDGVATTNLAGRTLADLVLCRETDLTTLPWVGHRSPNWEPEPIRWLSIRTSLRLPAGADRFEQRTGRPERLRSWILDTLTAH